MDFWEALDNAYNAYKKRWDEEKEEIGAGHSIALCPNCEFNGNCAVRNCNICNRYLPSGSFDRMK